MTVQLVGIKHIKDEVEILPTIEAEMSVVGFVGTATGADEEAFPLNTNVYLHTSDTALVAKAGTGGWLPDALRALIDQLGVAQGAAKVVVRRVAAGVNTAATVANVLGQANDNSGIYGLIDAGEEHGVTPRIVVCELTDWTNGNGVDAITLTAAGDNLTAAPAVVFSGGGSDPGKVLPTAIAVLGTGGNAEKVVSITLTSTGANLTQAPTISFTGGGSEGDKVLPTATCTIAQLANPVCAALPAILNTLRAHAIVQGPSTSYAAWLNWRETMQSERLIPTPAQRVLVAEGGNTVARDFAPRLAGIMVRRDNEKGGSPLYSCANQPVYGIVGVSRRVRFNLADPNNEGGDIIAANGGVIARGDVGVESALGSGGFLYWGTDNLSEDPLWQFYHVTRGRDYIELAQMKTLRKYLGRTNITRQTVQAIINTVSTQLARLRNRGEIIDFRVGFEADKNLPEDLRLGFLTIFFRAEEVPVLRKITVHSRRYREALDTLVNQIAVQLASISAVE